MWTSLCSLGYFCVWKGWYLQATVAGTWKKLLTVLHKILTNILDYKTYISNSCVEIVSYNKVNEYQKIAVTQN